MAAFSTIFADVTKLGTKLQTSEYLEYGKHPIVDQGQDIIAGYTNQEEGLFSDVPVIVFGDHTRVVKYIDTPFFLGADGVKVLKGIRPDTDTRYLYYAVSAVRIPNTGYNRHFKWLKEADFPLPDLPTQRRIAATLDKVSEGIELCRKMLGELDELVRARFVEMFGDPVENSMGWPMQALSECLDGIENGKSFVCDNHSREGEYPAVLKLSAATTGTYDPGENKAVIDESDFVDSAEVHDGDLLFTRKNTPELVGMAAYVFKTPPKLMMPDIIFRLNTDEKHCKKIYLWQLINHTIFRPCIQDLANGSAKSMSNISKEKLTKLLIPVPAMDTQEQFIDFYIQADKSKSAIQRQLSALETLKKSLMQEYFG